MILKIILILCVIHLLMTTIVWITFTQDMRRLKKDKQFFDKLVDNPVDPDICPKCGLPYMVHGKDFHWGEKPTTLLCPVYDTLPKDRII